MAVFGFLRAQLARGLVDGHFPRFPGFVPRVSNAQVRRCFIELLLGLDLSPIAWDLWVYPNASHEDGPGADVYVFVNQHDSILSTPGLTPDRSLVGGCRLRLD